MVPRGDTTGPGELFEQYLNMYYSIKTLSKHSMLQIKQQIGLKVRDTRSFNKTRGYSII